MKILVMITISALMIVSTVQAERNLRGTINKVDAKNGYIVIEDIQYRMEPGKTKVFSSGQTISDDFLEEGIKVYFSIDDESMVSEIKLITPVQFED